VGASLRFSGKPISQEATRNVTRADGWLWRLVWRDPLDSRAYNTPVPAIIPTGGAT